MTTNSEYVEDHGPTRRGSLPNDELSISDKRDGLAWFYAGLKVYNGTEPVAYYFQDHDKETVIDEWKEANQEYFERENSLDVRSCLRKAGSSWSDAYSETERFGRWTSETAPLDVEQDYAWITPQGYVIHLDPDCQEVRTSGKSKKKISTDKAPRRNGNRLICSRCQKRKGGEDDELTEKEVWTRIVNLMSE